MGAVTPSEEVGRPAALRRDVAWLLSQAGHALVTQQQARLDALGMTPRGYCVMTVAETGDFSQTEIARCIGLDKTTMVVTVDALEKDGLVERLPSPTDRRARVIAVTDAGRAKVTEAGKLVAQVEEEVLGTLGEEERERLVDALVTLVTGPLEFPATCSTPVRRRS